MSNTQPPSGYDAPQAGQPGSGDYPSYPGYPADTSESAPAAAAPQPPSTRTAVRLMWVGAGISLLSLVLTLVSLGGLKSQIRDQAEKNGQHITSSQLDALYAGVVGFSVVIALISIGLWLWMAWKNGQGRSWARIVATVLGVLNVIVTLLSFTGGRATPGAAILSVVNLVLAVVILVLLWRKDSSQFYAASSARPLG